jgi:hypothetical protein
MPCKFGTAVSWGIYMKNQLLKKLAITGLICVFLLPIKGHAGPETSSMKAYLEEKNPKTLGEYPSIFEYLYDKHTSALKEATQLTVMYFFTAADEPQLNDILSLTNIAVIAAIAQADAELAQAEVLGEEQKDNRGLYISEAVCGSFKGALGSSYKQVTSAGQAVEGGLQAALTTGIDPDFAATVVTRGIDTCLEERLENDVRIIIGDGELPGSDTSVCVSNCI